MFLTSLKDRTVWITGASGGIGREMALLAARSGARLVLVSSRPESLEDAARECRQSGALSVRAGAIDLSREQEAARQLAALAEECAAPDYLILNAGVSQRSTVLETSAETARKIMELNYFGAVAAARALLPGMIEAGGGCIGVTSSLTGVFGFPLRSSYSASKHALQGYFESLALEYASSGISVTLAIPGFIRTNISKHALSGDGSRHGKMDENQKNGMSPQLCARKYWKAVIRRRPRKVIGGIDTIMVFFYNYLPVLYRFLGKRVSPV